MKLGSKLFAKISPDVEPSCHVDQANNQLIRGWVESLDDLAGSMIKIASSTDQVVIHSDIYRPDVRRVSRHRTGLCGFSYDISCWVDKKCSVSYLGKKCNAVNHHRPLFFVHIPKTAGTSFKRAAADYFGNDAVIKNYGKKSPETSKIVHEMLLNKKQQYEIYLNMQRQGVGLYTGHVHLASMMDVFPAKDIVSFVRHPVEQVLSHFNHYRLHYDYSASVETFINQQGFKNLQSRFLGGVPVQLIGFVGLTEAYDSSLEIFNKSYKTNIKGKRLNVIPEDKKVAVSQPLVELIKENNTRDFELYQLCKDLLAQRTELTNRGVPWCYGFIDKPTKDQVSGLAYWADSDKPVELSVFHDKGQGQVHLGDCTASLIKPAMKRYAVPRSGFVGFTFKFPDACDRKNIRVVIKKTGQQLTEVQGI
ncbi:sulfotransferase family 2 domain-containing protein [Pelagibaculum spongiae]|uniref:Sulfotransferase family protein n=1 Tax=Pelagibaculum spongiae TaxID=2080658 RepID=A0A2V1H2J5_9GAMM|nr:sulfotransferase family 2 domain-containing protein [Pelagibaculum spongiae]PVZ70239.1 hypothetical protein DC094_06465 [Pelagibaculum spongiae]